MTASVVVHAAELHCWLADATRLYEARVPLVDDVRDAVVHDGALKPQLDAVIAQLEDGARVSGAVTVIVGADWILARLAHAALVRALAALGAELIEADADGRDAAIVAKHDAEIERLVLRCEAIATGRARWR